jgi:single-strand DNA-binding protein
MANFNFNKVILGGRLTADPELKTTQNGLSVTTVNIAIGRKFAKDETDFISVTAWRQTAELICNYFKKGSSICIVGSLQVRNYTDKDGNKRYITEVVADEVNFVDSKGENGGGNNNTPYVPDAYKKPAEAPVMEEIDLEDDMLPF